MFRWRSVIASMSSSSSSRRGRRGWPRLNMFISKAARSWGPQASVLSEIPLPACAAGPGSFRWRKVRSCSVSRWRRRSAPLEFFHLERARLHLYHDVQLGVDLLKELLLRVLVLPVVHRAGRLLLHLDHGRQLGVENSCLVAGLPVLLGGQSSPWRGPSSWARAGPKNQNSHGGEVVLLPMPGSALSQTKSPPGRPREGSTMPIATVAARSARLPVLSSRTKVLTSSKASLHHVDLRGVHSSSCLTSLRDNVTCGGLGCHRHSIRGLRHGHGIVGRLLLDHHRLLTLHHKLGHGLVHLQEACHQPPQSQRRSGWKFTTSSVCGAPSCEPKWHGHAPPHQSLSSHSWSLLTSSRGTAKLSMMRPSHQRQKQEKT